MKKRERKIAVAQIADSYIRERYKENLKEGKECPEEWAEYDKSSAEEYAIMLTEMQLDDINLDDIFYMPAFGDMMTAMRRSFDKLIKEVSK